MPVRQHRSSRRGRRQERLHVSRRRREVAIDCFQFLELAEKAPLVADKLATNPENGATSYTYNADGTMATKADAKSQVLTYYLKLEGGCTPR